MVAQREAELHLPEERRREIFLALVDAQDRGMAVVQSCKEVAERFGVSDHRLRQIEREGLDSGWPPLNG
jgi:hypothetical protein